MTFTPTTKNKIMSRYKTQLHRQAYTLIELLVVISIMIVSVALIIPAINKFVELATDNTARNAFNVASTTIRAYATRNISDGLNLYGSTYGGVALIVTPACELRMVEDNQFATASLIPHNYINVTSNAQHGYVDIEGRDYITMPKDTGIVGILTPTGTTRYISPPFAIRFDKKGQLAVTNSSDDASYVYYDGNYDGYYNITSATDGYDRANPFDGSGTYKVEQWDPNDKQYWDMLGTTSENNALSNKPGKYTPTNNNDEDVNYGKYKLPFERLEAVIGVILYSKSKLREDGGFWPGTTSGTDWPSPTSGCDAGPCSDFEEWLQDNGHVMFFSRYTGVLLQNK